jgi:hypothetical protein
LDHSWNASSTVFPSKTNIKEKTNYDHIDQPIQKANKSKENSGGEETHSRISSLKNLCEQSKII